MSEAPDDRYAQLDEFATQKAAEKQPLVPAYTTHAPPPSLFHGTVRVPVPRNEAEVRMAIAASASAAGDDWYYSIPYRDRKTNKTTYVEGPSIKLANEIIRLYGHSEVDQWVSSEGIDYVEFTARFIDLERGYAMTRVFRQRKGAAKVGTDQGRNDEITFAIGASKAIRNVICNALQSFADYAFERARNSLVERIGKDIEHYRKTTAERIARLVDIKRVEAVIGRPVAEWLARDIAQVVAMGKAVADGMALVDDSFPPLQRQEHGSTKDQLDKAASDAATSSTPPEEGAGEKASPASRTEEDASSNAPAPDRAAQQQKLHVEATTKLLQLAGDKKLDEQTRLSILEDAAPQWEDKLDPGYFALLMKTCIQVAKGFMSAKEGQKAMAGQ